MNREEFFSRVRDATAAGRAYRIHTADVTGERVGYAGAADDPAARLIEEVNKVGGTAHRAKSHREARNVLAALLRECRPASALCWQHAVLERLGLCELLAELGVRYLAYDELAALDPAMAQKRMLEAEIGISSVTYAVAETGTLAVASATGRERSASLLPPVHVAVVEADQILADLFDLFDALETAGLDRLSSNLTLITGPSKTGDIELTLTTGVHGPGRWHVIVIAPIVPERSER